jgi:hypothetical protein
MRARNNFSDINRLIRNDEDACVKALALLFNDSPWSNRYSSKLLSSIRRWEHSPRGEKHTGSKTQLWRPVVDKKRRIVQAAFCVNHRGFPGSLGRSGKSESVSPSDTGTERLVVFFQYCWPEPPAAEETGEGPSKATTKEPTEQAEEWRNRNVIILFEQSPSRFAEVKRSVLFEGLRNRAKLFQVETDLVPPAISPDHFQKLCVLDFVKFTIESVFEGLIEDWAELIDEFSSKLSKITDEIYSAPDDDSRATELWNCSRSFQHASKMINLTSMLVEDIQDVYEKQTKDDREKERFLDQSLKLFKILGSEVFEELQKPTEQLIDLMYKSVSIKDARLSLELNSSLWRLSWVTFIFLPLTFLVSFFGMNVDTFQNNPSLKWYVTPLALCP